MKLKKIVILFIIMILIIIIPNINNAASFSISSSRATINVGETVEINVSAGKELTGKFSVSASGSANVSLSTSSIWVENGNITDGGPITVKANSAGTVNISVTAVNVDNGGTGAYTGSWNCSITVQGSNNNEPKSDNQQPAATAGGKLSSITVNGKTYKDPKQDITVTVGNEVESTTVSAVSADGSAVSGTGKTTLKVGSNTVNLKVGGTNYVVRINRLAKVEEETPPNLIDETQTNSDKNEDALALNSIEIKGFTFTPEFSKDVFSYTLDIDMEKNDVSELEINVVPNKQNAKVAITGNKLLQEGENIINITVTSEDGKETVTYQLKVNKIVYSTEVVGQNHDEINDLNEELEDTTKTSKTVQIIIVAIAIIGLVCGIIFAIIEYIYTNKKENDNEENEYNEPFYIKENEEGRIEVVDENNDLYDDEEKNEKIDEEDIENKKLEEETENMGYIEELYKYNFPDEDIEEDIEKPKRKKSKGKHF